MRTGGRTAVAVRMGLVLNLALIATLVAGFAATIARLVKPVSAAFIYVGFAALAVAGTPLRHRSRAHAKRGGRLPDCPAVDVHPLH